ncbi:MAG: flagellar protein FlaG [Anaerolineales bacterium]|uniref:flagellar protein FlaG n=1 Tax=Candidatus Villigracilis vicinus TaxID=3140679 RepID=UPI003136902A|nr:flagellar protein FlaG [Anaerolineales bacterium]
MNESSIKPISGVQLSDGSAISRALAAQAESAAQVRVSDAAHKASTQVETKKASNELASLANVSIHFRVDEATNNVTVFLVDRKTKKVLRSIPSNELQKLQISDLLKLTI